MSQDPEKDCLAPSLHFEELSLLLQQDPVQIVQKVGHPTSMGGY